ncbi:MAG: MBL fold metallo-hydrolase [Desulfobacterales bacterium]|nr:MBL fold metallo-hydrolase [Desulfobacterales bacterium]MBF0398929.1 MBL fold metallo-hydrolase [Desulfobacterales bacterium]
MKIGNYECLAVDFGDFVLDGGAMFGVVPKVLWEKGIPADEKNRIPMKNRSLLIIGMGRKILVDIGIGDKLSEKYRNIYGIGKVSITESLAKYNLSCEDITDVFMTHLHFDHCGGATHLKNNKIIPTFPNATYYIQKSQWDYAYNPTVRDISSYLEENFAPLKEKGVIKYLNGGQEIFQGIEVIVTNGHTEGQQHLLIRGNKTSLFFCADLIPTSFHMPITWNMAYDNYPLILMKEKEDILTKAEKENWILFFEHDPKVAAIKLSSDGTHLPVNF